MIQVVGAQVGSENIHRSVPRIKEPRNLLKFKGGSMAFQPIDLVSIASLPCLLPFTVEKQICACAMAGSFARDMMISQGDRVAPFFYKERECQGIGLHGGDADSKYREYREYREVATILQRKMWTALEAIESNGKTVLIWNSASWRRVLTLHEHLARWSFSFAMGF